MAITQESTERNQAGNRDEKWALELDLDAIRLLDDVFWPLVLDMSDTKGIDSQMQAKIIVLHDAIRARLATATARAERLGVNGEVRQ